MSFFETLWYYASNILTFGGAFTIKVIIKKAILEAMEGLDK